LDVPFCSANASPQYRPLSQLFPLLEGAEFAEALQWSAKYCAERQVKIDATSRALGRARP
jgi:hypothetical protein